MFGTHENKEAMLLYFGSANITESLFYPKIQRDNKDYRQFDPNDLIPRTLAMAAIWVEDYMQDYTAVAVAGEGFGGFIANVISHELNLPALLFNPLLAVEGFDFPLNTSKTVEVFVNEDRFLIEKSSLPNNWDITILGKNEKFNQEMLNWVVADICNDGWAWTDDSVWFGDD